MRASNPESYGVRVRVANDTSFDAGQRNRLTNTDMYKSNTSAKQSTLKDVHLSVTKN